MNVEMCRDRLAHHHFHNRDYATVSRASCPCGGVYGDVFFLWGLRVAPPNRCDDAVCGSLYPCISYYWNP